ncbi:MAG: CIA30 family protein [Algibacter sp.]|uniref:CIA30 family protein n=1 Tax=Algibacter sp. TaxID=1872428 RepID=UPI00261171F3|nr:CIA30 family protein [Algibacter sp.]MDG1728814.1 CIA30 family protein [Algibacter sp.]MDG2177287.1 CIA30 family protein [Algibacter sp.]
MKNLVLLILLIIQNPMTLFDFDSKSDISNWKIVDDVVMGGRSKGNFKINDAGNGFFFGDVSLENNGGFSMVQYRFDTKKTDPYSKVCIKLKGDGKTYQFRIKENDSDYYSYVVSFDTSKDWETIEIPFKNMYPAFRGRKLDTPNFSGKQMEMIAFLIGNKNAEVFNLEIENIVLK